MIAASWPRPGPIWLAWVAGSRVFTEGALASTLPSLPHTLIPSPSVACYCGLLLLTLRSLSRGHYMGLFPAARFSC